MTIHYCYVEENTHGLYGIIINIKKLVIHPPNCKIPLMPVTINNGETFCGFCAEHEDAFQGDECLFANENPVELTNKLLLNDNSSDNVTFSSCHPSSAK